MSSTLITAPASEPITLDEAKVQCRVDGTAEDALLAIYIAAARQACEARIFQRLLPQTWEDTFDAFPAGDAGILCGQGPLRSVTQITYVDAAGATQTLSPSAYYVDTRTAPGWVLPAAGSSWPATDGNVNAVTVRYVAGLAADAATLHSDARAWVLLCVGTLYAQREGMDLNGRAAPLPDRFWESLLDPLIDYSR